MGQLRYYDEDDIQKIADSCRYLIGSERRLKTSEMGDFLKNHEIKTRKVNSDYKNIYYKYYDDISPYRQHKDTNGYYVDYPSLTYEDGSDYNQYIFAGWFHTKNSTTTTILNATTSGPAYAKFIPASLLSSKVQLGTGTTMDSAFAPIRILSCILDLALAKLACSLKIENEESVIYTSTNIYVGLYAGANYKFFAKDMNPYATYISAIVPNSIANEHFSDILTIKTGYVTIDNTLVLGHSYRNKLEDYITAEINAEKTRNLPVIIRCPEPITNASFDIQFDNSFYNYEQYYKNSEMNAIVNYVNTPGVGDPTLISISLNFNQPTILNDCLLNLMFKDIFDTEQTKNPSKIMLKVLNEKLTCNGQEVLCNSVLEPSEYVVTYTYVGESTTTYSLRRNVQIRLNDEEAPIALFLDDKNELEAWNSLIF